jgi:hypothetical protein
MMHGRCTSCATYLHVHAPVSRWLEVVLRMDSGQAASGDAQAEKSGM